MERGRSRRRIGRQLPRTRREDVRAAGGVARERRLPRRPRFRRDARRVELREPEERRSPLALPRVELRAPCGENELPVDGVVGDGDRTKRLPARRALGRDEDEDVAGVATRRRSIERRGADCGRGRPIPAERSVPRPPPERRWPTATSRSREPGGRETRAPTGSNRSTPGAPTPTRQPKPDRSSTPPANAPNARRVGVASVARSARAWRGGWRGRRQAAADRQRPEPRPPRGVSSRSRSDSRMMTAVSSIARPGDVDDRPVRVLAEDARARSRAPA